MSSPAIAVTENESSSLVPGFSGQKLTLSLFTQMAGKLAGHPFVKVVLDRETGKAHFINNNRYPFHADYVGEQILGKPPGAIDLEIDAFNQTVYFDADRRFYFGILSLQKTPDAVPEINFLTLETVEVDTMDRSMVEFFFRGVKEWVDPLIPVLFKPANTLQEAIVKEIDPASLPRIFSHELFATARFIALNPGRSLGRIRAFKSEMDYKRVAHTIEWYDIVVMHRVPDDIPRIAGIVNAHHTTPLSHTNVLASGWKIPNCIQLGIFEKIERENLHEQWVEYVVENSADELSFRKAEAPKDVQAPAWKVNRVEIESPEIANTPILSLDHLRAADRYKYGTKSANLGEMRYVLAHGSERMLGFYRMPRPPRENLMPYLAKFLGVPEQTENMGSVAHEFLKKAVRVPSGIAIPFSVQQEFLESASQIQQAIGKLKMALELEAREIESLCLQLQQMIRQVRMPDKIRNRIDAEIAKHLPGVSSFVVRSSSNAEDLQGFSAAGIYESISHVSQADKIFESVKEVWASLLSPRSVRLRHQVGISLDDCYMGVLIQEMVESDIGGVLVTTNPSNRQDFRSVYMNVSAKSVENVVHGSVLPIQMLYNTVEGGGRTMSLGDFSEGITPAQAVTLQKLAFAGRLLQSHFSPDYTFSQPVDIEWLAGNSGINLLQLRPYSE